MRIVNNTTDIPTYVLERAFVFGTKGIKKKHIKRPLAEIGVVQLERFSIGQSRPCVCCRFLQKIILRFTENADPIEAVIAGACNALLKDGGYGVLDSYARVLEYRQNKGAMLLRWHIPPVRTKRRQPTDKALAKAQAHVATWTRRLKLAKTKLSKYSRAVKRLEKKQAASNAVA